MSNPVMTDEELREALLKELRSRAVDFRSGATLERSIAKLCGHDAIDRVRATSHLRYAAHFDRCAAHYQQAIDLLTAAPMPAKEDASGD